MSAALQQVREDDPKGNYRTFVLEPYFTRSFSSLTHGGLAAAFAHNVPSRETLELAFISEAYDIDLRELVRAVSFSPDKVGFDRRREIPSVEDVDRFKRMREWSNFVESSSIETYRNLVSYDPYEVFPEKIIPDNLAITTPDQLISDLLMVNDGVALGDKHADLGVIDFMKSRLPDLCEKGVQTMYFEMVESKDQDRLDEYMRTGDPDIIEETIDNAWDRKGDGDMKKEYIAVLDAAREVGIRVVAIDKAEMGHRFHDSNPHWTRVIEEDREFFPDGEKFIVFGGHYHFCDAPPNEGYSVASVSKRLGIPSVELRSGTEEPQLGTKDHENDFIVSLPERSEGGGPTVDTPDASRGSSGNPRTSCSTLGI